MGNFIESFIRPKTEKLQIYFFIANSLSKIHYFYGHYKRISYTFAIDDSEFIYIFGNKINIFYLFDTDCNLLIDGLELFCGLILLSTIINFDYKIYFLFHLFDFNEIKSLSKTDIEFMFLSCCSAISKIFSVKGNIDYYNIHLFVISQFPYSKRINISEMLKWATNSQTILGFFSKITINSYNIHKNTVIYKKYLLQYHKEDIINVFDKYYKKQETFLAKSLQLFKKEDSNFKYCDLAPSIHWIYGARHFDVHQFLEYIPKQYCIIYFVGKVVVIFSFTKSIQRHYNGHQKYVISITSFNNTIATGEYGTESQVRIWDCETLKTKKILKGAFAFGCHLLKFFKYGSLLIIGCCSYKSPILIYDTYNWQLMYSCHCRYPAIEIELITNLTKKSVNEFIVASLYEVYYFKELGGKIYRKRLCQKENTAKITCCKFLQTNLRLKQFSYYDEEVERQILTGHYDGTVYLWGYRKLCNLGSRLWKIIADQKGIIFVTNSSFISFWNLLLSQQEKIIDLTQMQTTLKSYDVRDVFIITRYRLLVLTKAGDLLIIQKYKPNYSIFKYKLAETLYYVEVIDKFITIDDKILSQKLIQTDEETILYVALSRSIEGINTRIHKRCQEWTIGEEITAFDGVFISQVGVILFAGTKLNKIYCLYNNNYNLNKIQMESYIITLSIMYPSLLVGCSNSYIYKLLLQKGQLHFQSSIHFPYTPFYINCLDTESAIVVSYKDSLYYLMTNSKELHFESATESKKQLTRSTNPVLKLFQKGVMRCAYPFITGAASKAFFIARESGAIYVWKNAEGLSDANSMILLAHASSCADFSVSNDQRLLFSSGRHDGLIAEWDLRLFIENASLLNPKPLKYQNLRYTSSYSIDRRVSFCTFENDILSKLYDSHLLVRGVKNDILHRMFKANMREWAQINETTMFKEEPKVSLKIDYVFGMETFHKNNTVIAISEPRRFVYFVSRFIIRYNPTNNTQAVYMGHKYKVTCMTLLSGKKTMASAYCAFKPKIHVWDITTLYTIRVIDTVHNWGIIYIVATANILLSYGLKYRRTSQSNHYNKYSSQVTDWYSGEMLAHKTYTELVYAFAVNFANPMYFVTCVNNAVIFWEVQFNRIIKRSECIIPDTTVTCAVFWNTAYCKNPDLLVGTARGDFCIITQRKHFVSLRRSEQSHSAEINCILHIVKGDIEFFVTAAEDNCLRGWSNRFYEIFVQDMRKLYIEDSFKKVYGKLHYHIDRNFSVQSISEFDQEKGVSLLLGTRNGYIFLMKQTGTDLSFRYSFYLKSNESQGKRRKVLMAHHPQFEIIATLSYDSNLLFWDTYRRKNIFGSYLNVEGGVPTAMRFTQNGDYLLVGFSDGQLLFLDARISRSVQVRIDEKYMSPTLHVVKKEKDEDGHAVLAIEVAETYDFLAVSYHLVTDTRSHSFIDLYLTRPREKSKNKSDNYRLFYKLSRVPCPFPETVFTQGDAHFGFAAYFISFAHHEGKDYCLIYYQEFDYQQRREQFSYASDEEKNYKIWDISTSTVVTNTNLVDSLHWKKFNIHNSLRCFYCIHPYSLSLRLSPNDYLDNNNQITPKMTYMAIFNGFIIVASNDLHILRTSALHYPNERTPAPNEMCVGKIFPAHATRINQIEVNPERKILYTSGLGDECVVKWLIEGTHSDQFITEEEADVFNYIPCAKTYYPTRYTQPPSIDFIDRIEVLDLFGRKALRNNLKYDHVGRIISASGHTLVCYESNQRELIYKPTPFEEVSAVEVCGRQVYSAHNGQQCGLLVWDGQSKTTSKEINLRVINTVLYMAVSGCGERVAVYGVGQRAWLLLVDVRHSRLLAAVSYGHKAAWHIKAIGFLPAHPSCFVTCGVEDTKIWTLCGCVLTYKELPTLLPKTLELIHMCIAFPLVASQDFANGCVEGTIVTGCADGSLVLWRKETLRLVYHTQSILCLAVQGSFLVSGGRDPFVLLWECTQPHLRVLAKIDLTNVGHVSIHLSRVSVERYIYEIYVQSLCMQSDKILIGTIEGDILYYSINDKELNTVLNFHDTSVPIAVFITNKHLFELTDKGLLTIWSLYISKVINRYSFNYKAIAMLYSKKKYIIFFAFYYKIRSFVLTYSYETVEISEANELFLAIVKITQIMMSSNEKMLAVGVERNSNDTRLIEIYDITTNVFKLALKIPVDSQLELFDFNDPVSKYKAFIFVQTTEKVELWDLNLHKSINNDQISYIEWNHLCIAYSDKSKASRKGFSKDFPHQKIKSMMKLEAKTYIIFSTIGGIMIYVGDKMLSKCRLNISDISNASLSANKEYLAVCSETDRNIILMNVGKCLEINRNYLF